MSKTKNLIAATLAVLALAAIPSTSVALLGGACDALAGEDHGKQRLPVKARTECEEPRQGLFAYMGGTCSGSKRRARAAETMFPFRSKRSSAARASAMPPLHDLPRRGLRPARAGSPRDDSERPSAQREPALRARCAPPLRLLLFWQAAWLPPASRPGPHRCRRRRPRPAPPSSTLRLRRSCRRRRAPPPIRRRVRRAQRSGEAAANSHGARNRCTASSVEPSSRSIMASIRVQ